MIARLMFWLLAAIASGDNNQCSAHGVLHDGLCLCELGFFGPKCEDATCIKNCSHKGVCAHGVCYCEEGFTGQSCEERAVDALLSRVNAQEKAGIDAELSSARRSLEAERAESRARATEAVTSVSPSPTVVADSGLSVVEASGPPSQDLQLVESLMKQLADLAARPPPPRAKIEPVILATAAPAPVTTVAAASVITTVAAVPAVTTVAAVSVPVTAATAETATPSIAPASQLFTATVADEAQALLGTSVASASAQAKAVAGAIAAASLSQKSRRLRGTEFVQTPVDEDDEDGGWARPQPVLSASQKNMSIVPITEIPESPTANISHIANITVENTVFDAGHELSGIVDIADSASVHWKREQAILMTAACGGCNEKGTCDQSTRMCTCFESWQGQHCEQQVEKDSSGCPLGCGKHGNCLRDQCVCANGWSGATCDQQACPDNCGGNGVCINNVCICNDLFIGNTCQHRRCPMDCHGKGECIDSVCHCTDGYTGLLCNEAVQPPNGLKAAEAAQVGPPGLDAAGPVQFVKTSPIAECPEDCNFHGKCLGNECQCYTGYTGAACENFCPNFCSHQGECIEGACLCVAGFVGVDCSVSACCNGHGDCSIPDTCICAKGWMGATCGIAMPCFDAMCSGHGGCSGGACDCEPGWTGDDCATAPKECDPACQHGSCNRLAKNCVCDNGWSGADCATQGSGPGAGGSMPGAAKKAAEERGKSAPLMDAAGASAAAEAAIRAAAAAAAAAAKKAVEEVGERTEEEAVKEPCGPENACSAHGSCNVTIGLCTCDDNFDGDICDFEHCAGYNETTGAEDCNGHGMCMHGECFCAPGFGMADSEGLAMVVGAEESCEERVCPTSCGNHGKCEEGLCTCEGGWTGDTCHQPSCHNDCSGHGTCAFWSGHDSPGECECFPGFMGGDCATPETQMRACPNECNGNGLCFDGRCSCSDGFRGPDCGDAVCADPTRTGPKCDLPRCMNDCQGQGLCFTGQCECWPTFYGDDCGTPQDCVDACSHHCFADSRASICANCLGNCQTMVDGNTLGKHAWTEDIQF